MALKVGLFQIHEASKGKAKIGSTLKGIGPTYMDKTGRNGLRIGDIKSPSFQDRYQKLKEKHFNLLKNTNLLKDLESIENEFLESVEYLKKFEHIDPFLSLKTITIKNLQNLQDFT